MSITLENALLLIAKAEMLKKKTNIDKKKLREISGKIRLLSHEITRHKSSISNDENINFESKNATELEGLINDLPEADKIGQIFFFFKEVMKINDTAKNKIFTLPEIQEFTNRLTDFINDTTKDQTYKMKLQATVIEISTYMSKLTEFFVFTFEDLQKLASGDYLVNQLLLMKMDSPKFYDVLEGITRCLLNYAEINKLIVDTIKNSLGDAKQMLESIKNRIDYHFTRPSKMLLTLKSVQEACKPFNDEYTANFDRAISKFSDHNRMIDNIQAANEFSLQLANIQSKPIKSKEIKKFLKGENPQEKYDNLLLQIKNIIDKRLAFKTHNPEQLNDFSLILEEINQVLTCYDIDLKKIDSSIIYKVPFMKFIEEFCDYYEAQKLKQKRLAAMSDEEKSDYIYACEIGGVLRAPIKEPTSIEEKIAGINNKNIFLMNIYNEYTLFHIICEYGSAKLVNLVIDKFVLISSEASLINLEKPIAWRPKYLNLLLLQSAACNDSKRMLLCHTLGAALDTKNSSGKTALHLAIENGHESIVNSLLTRDFPVNKGNAYQAPLHSAAKERAGVSDDTRLNIIDRLLEMKADPNETNLNNETALHIAAKGNSVEIVDRLIDAKADLSMKDLDGNVPLQLMKPNGSLFNKFSSFLSREAQGKVMAQSSKMAWTQKKWHSMPLSAILSQHWYAKNDIGCRKVVLVDVNKTLVDETGKLNLSLILALKAQKIERILLLTEYCLQYNLRDSLRNNALHLDILRRLRRYGINVIGIITSGSSSYKTENNKVGHYYNETLQVIEHAARVKLFDRQDYDQAISEIEVQYQPFMEDELSTINKNVAIAEVLGVKQGKEHLLRYIITLLPNESEVVIYDDKAEVAQVADRLQKETPIKERNINLKCLIVDFSCDTKESSIKYENFLSDQINSPKLFGFSPISIAWVRLTAVAKNYSGRWSLNSELLDFLKTQHKIVLVHDVQDELKTLQERFQKKGINVEIKLSGTDFKTVELVAEWIFESQQNYDFLIQAFVFEQDENLVKAIQQDYYDDASTAIIHMKKSINCEGILQNASYDYEVQQWKYMILNFADNEFKCDVQKILTQFEKTVDKTNENLLKCMQAYRVFLISPDNFESADNCRNKLNEFQKVAITNSRHSLFSTGKNHKQEEQLLNSLLELKEKITNTMRIDSKREIAF